MRRAHEITTNIKKLPFVLELGIYCRVSCQFIKIKWLQGNTHLFSKIREYVTIMHTRKRVDWNIKENK